MVKGPNNTTDSRGDVSVGVEGQNWTESFKKDFAHMKALSAMIMAALDNNDNELPDTLRRVLGLNFLSFMYGDPVVAKQWFDICINMMKNNPQGFATFRGDWNIPEISIKFYGLRYLTDTQDPERTAIMAAAGITEEELNAFQNGPQANKKVEKLSGGIVDAVKAATAEA